MQKIVANFKSYYLIDAKKQSEVDHDTRKRSIMAFL